MFNSLLKQNYFESQHKINTESNISQKCEICGKQFLNGIGYTLHYRRCLIRKNEEKYRRVGRIKQYEFFIKSIESNIEEYKNELANTKTKEEKNKIQTTINFYKETTKSHASNSIFNLYHYHHFYAFI